MSNLKKYVITKFDSEITASYDTLDEAVAAYHSLNEAQMEPRILKLVEWKTNNIEIMGGEES